MKTGCLTLIAKISPRDFLGSDAKVSVLIDNDHRCWMKETINNIFLPHEAALILSIPLSLSSCEDWLFWPHNPDGSYSVRSGYRWLMEEELKEEPLTSDLSTTRSIWKGVWSSRVPNRVKTMLWRAGSDTLPSKTNLLKRKIITDDLCPSCKLKSETIFHALWSCPALAPVWSSKFAWLMKLTKECSSLLEIFHCCQIHSDCFNLFAMIASQLWIRRNKLRVGDCVAPLVKIVGLATDCLLEFQSAQSSPQPHSKPVLASRWSPPPPGWVKINFDGATFNDRNLAGLAGVIRNDRGLVMATFTQTIPLPISVEMVEVLAARNALVSAQDLNLTQVQLEGDSEIIINALSSGGRDSSSYGHILKDIKFLSSAFQCLSFSHTCRQGNKLAHCLARSACNFSPFQVWMEQIPLVFESVYSFDIP